MSVQSEMDRIKSNIQNTYSVLSDLGADVPSEPKSNNLAESAKTVSAVLFKSQDLTSEQKQQARANIEAAKQADVDNLSKEIVDQKIRLDGYESLTLGQHTDGLIYIFKNGVPVGNGVSVQGEVIESDVFGYVDENNHIVLEGNLADGTYTFAYKMDNGNIVDIGNGVFDSNVYYSIINNLTNCTSDNSTIKVVEGESYLATITANDGYELSSVAVTMGGSPVTVSGRTINITNVTGDIIITAVAEEIVVLEPVTENITLTSGIRIGSDGTDRTLAGYCATPHIDLTNIPKPCVVNLKNAKWCFEAQGTTGTIMMYAAKVDGSAATVIGTYDGYDDGDIKVVANNGSISDVSVTITSDNIKTIRFSGCWGQASGWEGKASMEEAGTTASLTYTPIA